MGIISDSNMGIAVRGLFSDAAGMTNDLLTLPLRHAFHNFNMDPDEEVPIVLKAMCAGFIPSMSAMVAGGTLFVGGEKHLPLAVSAGLAFQYSMDLLAGSILHMGEKKPFHLFPSLQPDGSGR